MWSELASTMGSVVRITVISRSIDSLQPWGASVGQSYGGSGFVVYHRRIVTNAHVVSGATFIVVKKPGSGTEYVAKVKGFANECDLAVLTVEDDEFWKDVDALELGLMPRLSERVHIVGYPKGGRNICVTSGIVSRIDTIQYSHSKSRLPTFQVDAAINAGNSGGPVFMGRKVAGVAFEKGDGDNMSFVIPAQLVRLFLAYLDEDDLEVGFCSLGLTTQPMENLMLRRYFKMRDEFTGILLTSIHPQSQASKVLRVNDVLMEINGIPIGDNGEVSDGDRDGLSFSSVISLKTPGEAVSLLVLRNEEICQFSVTVRPISVRAITDASPSPSYYILAGFVFTNVDNCRNVIISQVLEADINKGYTSLEGLMVLKFNGEHVLTVMDICMKMLKSSTGDVRLDLEGNQVVIINLKVARESHDSIMEFHHVRSSMSKDILEALVLTVKKGEE